MLASGIPIFFAGLGEDLTKSVSPLWRIVFAFISALRFIYFSGYMANSVDIPLVKPIFRWTPTSVIISAIAIAGVANAVNIIDGFNGLASGSLIVMFTTLGIFGAYADDPILSTFAFAHVAAIFGFFVWNFPFGRIFLGDGGAYYLGFALGAGVIMSFERNMLISPWSAVLILAYPLTETLFSIYRKARREGHSPSQPDRVHLHMLMRRSYGRPISKAIGDPDLENPITGIIMWMFPLISCTLAVIGLFWPPVVSTLFFLGYFLFYLSVYSRVSLTANKRKNKRGR